MQRPDFYARPTQEMGCDRCATPLDRIERYSRKEMLQSTSKRTEHYLPIYLMCDEISHVLAGGRHFLGTATTGRRPSRSFEGFTSPDHSTCAGDCVVPEQVILAFVMARVEVILAPVRTVILMFQQISIVSQQFTLLVDCPRLTHGESNVGSCKGITWSFSPWKNSAQACCGSSVVSSSAGSTSSTAFRQSSTGKSLTGPACRRMRQCRASA